MTIINWWQENCLRSMETSWSWSLQTGIVSRSVKFSCGKPMRQRSGQKSGSVNTVQEFFLIYPYLCLIVAGKHSVNVEILSFYQSGYYNCILKFKHNMFWSKIYGQKTVRSSIRRRFLLSACSGKGREYFNQPVYSEGNGQTDNFFHCG